MALVFVSRSINFFNGQTLFRAISHWILRRWERKLNLTRELFCFLWLYDMAPFCRPVFCDLPSSLMSRWRSLLWQARSHFSVYSTRFWLWHFYGPRTVSSAQSPPSRMILCNAKSSFASQQPKQWNYHTAKKQIISLIYKLKSLVC